MTSSAGRISEASTASGVSRGALGRAVHWLHTNDRWAHVVLFTVFAVLVLTGVTTSNISQDYLQPIPDGRDWILVGQPQEIRWDEYLGGSPTFMSIMATQDLPALSPLSAQAGLLTRYSEGGFFASLVFFDGTLLRLGGVVPEPMLFSLRWWLPMILLLSCMPIWFRQLGLDSRLGWLAGLVIVASPSVAWWSMQPVNVMGYTLAGCVALLAAFERFARRRWIQGGLLGGIAAVLLAGMPSGYVVWAIILGLPLLVVSVTRILVRADVPIRTRWLTLVGVGAATIGLAAGMLWDSREGISALSSTLYPGDRREASAPVPFEMLFGAPATVAATGGGVVADAEATNASELSTSWTIAFAVVAAVLVLTGWTRLRRDWRYWLPTGVIVIWGGAWLVWSTVSLGDASAALPVFNRVLSLRAAQVVGVLGVLAACMLLSRTTPRRTPAGVTAAVAGVVTVYAASLLQTTVLPEMSTAVVWLSAAGTGAAVFIAMQWGSRVWGVVVVALLAALPALTVNPLTVGLAAYRDSAPADYFAEEAPAVRAAGQVWASDFRAMDVMMLANGLPSLSGPQPSGPDSSMWLQIDPDGASEEAWNRGGSRIRIVWRDEPGVVVESESYNVITIRANPCDLHARLTDLTTIMSRDVLDSDCLAEVETLPWKDTPVHVYSFTEDAR